MNNKNYKGYYSSTYSFVEENSLEKEAEELFGKDWEADDDINQIQKLLNSINSECVVVLRKETTKRDSRTDDYIHVL